MSEKVCGTCKFNRKDWECKFNTDFYCGNQDSENYGYNTMYLDSCEDWEEKDE